MNRLLLLLPLLVAPAGFSWAQRTSPPIVITHVGVVDVANGRGLPDQSVVIEGDRIKAVGPASAVISPRGTRVVDGRGAWLIPGLWDMHVHLGGAGKSALSLLVANGVTAVRDMGGSFEQVRAWRDSITNGSLLGPRIELVGPIVENAQWLSRVVAFSTQRGDTSIARQIQLRIGVATPEQARAAVDSMVALGVHLLKLRNDPPPAAYFALLRAARERGIKVVGHPPERGPSLAAASDSGQASIEHSLLSYRDNVWFPTLEPMSPAERADLWTRLRHNHTALVPTLIAGIGFRRIPDSLALLRIADSAGILDQRRRYIPAVVAAAWKGQIEMKQMEGAQPDWNDLSLRASRYLRPMDSAGVAILTGTDLGTPLTYPGFGLHDELKLLVQEGGLSPARALWGATLGPARFFGVEGEVGTVATGMRADLVLLAGDPLADIANVGRVRAVFLGGRLLDRPELDRVLAEVEAGVRRGQ